ncbi:MAG: nucleotidyltransferase family protein [Actinomycetota bacterium]|nr:nucleotidyltransferase family protein [Actinomycetota bacterium]
MLSVTAVVLAAGASKRMGEPKLLLPYRDSTVLNATIAAVEASAIERLIVVVGAGAQEIEESIESESATIVQNPDYRRGNMSSLLTATAADARAGAFVIVPGDLPTIRTDVIDSMIDLWIETKPWAAVTEYSNRIAHPFLLSAAAVESMGDLTGEKVLGRLLVESYDARILRLRVPHVPPRDMNTPDDYEALLTDL